MKTVRLGDSETMSKGPGKLSLRSGRINTREHALMIFATQCQLASTNLLRARFAQTKALAKELRADARAAGRMAREWYQIAAAAASLNIGEEAA